MQQEINVTDEDIRYAESILLSEGKTFDEERIEFIKNFETIDLQAVPGSGKTTALLAKLLILETRLPLINNRGILILSHTNIAVDEIKEKIGKYCPKLFSYPNFIGTIQAFVDQFLAIPFYTQQFKKKIIRIDNEIYNERISKCLGNLWFHRYNYSEEKLRQVAYIKNSNEGIFYNYRFKLDGDMKILTKSLNSSKLEIVKPRGNTRPNNYNDYSQQQKENIYNWFIKLKSEILKEGILHYDDAYFLADIYLQKYYQTKNIIQNRFKYVFVDEMQDVAGV
jgi:superfamily I DNA/RNA helicase